MVYKLFIYVCKNICWGGVLVDRLNYWERRILSLELFLREKGRDIPINDYKALKAKIEHYKAMCGDYYRYMMINRY